MQQCFGDGRVLHGLGALGLGCGDRRGIRRRADRPEVRAGGGRDDRALDDAADAHPDEALRGGRGERALDPAPARTELDERRLAIGREKLRPDGDVDELMLRGSVIDRERHGSSWSRRRRGVAFDIDRLPGFLTDLGEVRRMDAEVVLVLGVLAPRSPRLVGDHVKQAAREPGGAARHPAARLVGVAGWREREARRLHVTTGEDREPVMRPERREQDRAELEERLLEHVEERAGAVRHTEQVVGADPPRRRAVLRREPLGLGVGEHERRPCALDGVPALPGRRPGEALGIGVQPERVEHVREELAALVGELLRGMDVRHGHPDAGPVGELVEGRPAARVVELRLRYQQDSWTRGSVVAVAMLARTELAPHQSQLGDYYPDLSRHLR